MLLTNISETQKQFKVVKLYTDRAAPAQVHAVRGGHNARDNDPYSRNDVRVRAGIAHTPSTARCAGRSTPSQHRATQHAPLATSEGGVSSWESSAVRGRGNTPARRRRRSTDAD